MDDEDYRPRHPNDPRQHPCYRSRGPKRYRFTVDDIAAAARVTPAAVRKARQRGRVDLDDIGSIARWVSARAARASRR